MNIVQTIAIDFENEDSKEMLSAYSYFNNIGKNMFQSAEDMGYWPPPENIDKLVSLCDSITNDIVDLYRLAFNHEIEDDIID